MSESRELDAGTPATAPSAPRPAPRPRTRSASTTVLIMVSVLGAGMFAVSLAAVAYLFALNPPGKVNNESFLDVRLTPELQEAPAQGGLLLNPDDFPPVVTEIAAAVRQAATDDRINGVLLRLESPGIGWGSAQEIRTALVALRGAGKPCVAYAETYDTLSYYVASACDHVVLAPSGIGMVTGIAASTTFYKGTFDLLGIEPEMEHVGEFKSAVEPFERTSPSDEAMQATQSLLDSLWAQWVEDVAAGRGQDAASVKAWVDVPALSPNKALERGLVDVLAFPDQLRARVTTAGQEGWVASFADPAPDAPEAKLTPLKEYLKDVRRTWSSADRYVAVLHASGNIVSGESGGSLFSQQVVADKTFARWMKEVREDDHVVGVVLRVDSPGGSGLASDLMWREIERFRDTGRPVVVSMANAAASGGYYISAPANWIVAQPTTITGSIGVFGGKLNLTGLYEKIGLTHTTYKRGNQADLFSATSGFSETGREVYRTFLGDFYELFLQRVAQGRSMSRDQVHDVAQGRVWTGTQALERGLVDELGGIDRALAKVEELADVHDVGLVRWPKRKGFLEVLLQDLEGNDPDVAVQLLPGLAIDGVEQLMVLDRILSDGGAAALLPGALDLRGPP